MNRARKMFQDFLVAYISGKLDTVKPFFAEDTYINYSTVGQHIGFVEIQRALQWEDSFDVTVSTITNLMEFREGSDFLVCATVHHLLAFDQRNELFPFLFGGKYRFCFDPVREKIVGLEFDLEYEHGNTWLVKGRWHQYYNTCGNPRIIENEKLFLLPPVPQQISAEESIKRTIYTFFWALDTMDPQLAKNCVTPGFNLVRDGVVNDKLFANGKDDLPGFMDADKKYYDMNQYSVRINDVKVNGQRAVVKAQHLSPHKTGNKHLNSLTKYHQFFNEDIAIECVFDEGKVWKIDKVAITRAADVAYIGYKLLAL